MQGALCNVWLTAERFLWDVVDILQRKNPVACKLPFLPFLQKYHKPHMMLAVAMEHIHSGRDWFTMWISLLYWLTKKTPEGPEFIDGLSPPTWFKYVAVERKNDQAALDTLQTAPLLQSF